MRAEGFKGKRKEILLWHSDGKLPAKRYMVVGLGKRKICTMDLLREGCGLAARRAAAVKARRISLALPPIASVPDPRTAAEVAAEGIALGSYRMVKYMTGDDHRKISSVVLPIKPSGSCTSLSYSCGCSRKALRPWAAALRVVSFPAEERNMKNAASSGSPSE